MKKLYLITTIISLAGGLWGCAGLPKVAISKAEYSQLSSVSINPNVPLPKEFVYVGPNQAAAGFLFGAIGALIAEGASADTKTQLLQTLDRNDIKVGQIVSSEFEHQIRDAGFFLRVEAQGADAEFKMQVNIYGLYVCGQRQLCPILNLSGRLVRPDGKVVWQNTDFVTVNNKEITKSPHKLEELMAQPELLRESFRNAVRITSKMLIDDMRTQVGKL